MSLQSERFREQFGGDADTVFACCVLFLVASSLLWVIMQFKVVMDTKFKMGNVFPPLPHIVDGESGKLSEHVELTRFVFCFEDFPQLVFQALYFNAGEARGAAARARQHQRALRILTRIRTPP